MNYGVDLAYDGPAGPYGIDHVGMMEAMGALGRRVSDPDDIADALAWAVRASEEHQVPALVEVFVARETDVSMGPSIDAVREFDPLDEPVGQTLDVA
jgi:tartronate-semialdehyde synthase